MLPEQLRQGVAGGARQPHLLAVDAPAVVLGVLRRVLPRVLVPCPVRPEYIKHHLMVRALYKTPFNGPLSASASVPALRARPPEVREFRARLHFEKDSVDRAWTLVMDSAKRGWVTPAPC